MGIILWLRCGAERCFAASSYILFGFLLIVLATLREISCAYLTFRINISRTCTTCLSPGSRNLLKQLPSAEFGWVQTFGVCGWEVGGRGKIVVVVVVVWCGSPGVGRPYDFVEF